MDAVVEQQNKHTDRYGVNSKQAENKSCAECASTFSKRLGVTFFGVGAVALGIGGGIHGVNSNSTNVLVPPPVNQPVGLFLIELGAPAALFGFISVGVGYVLDYFTKPAVINLKREMPVDGYKYNPDTMETSDSFTSFSKTTERSEADPLIGSPTQHEDQVTGGEQIDKKIPLLERAGSQSGENNQGLDQSDKLDDVEVNIDGHSGSEGEVEMAKSLIKKINNKKTHPYTDLMKKIMQILFDES